MRKILISLVAVLATLYAATFVFPRHAAKIMVSGLAWVSGLETHITETSYGPVHYYEGGQGETVVFLHGVFARKEHWVDLSRSISDGYRVVLLDLPGFGENAPLPGGSYDFASQTKNLIELMDVMQLNDVHLVVNSMGAQLAGMVATQHPDWIKSISFIGSPVGVRSPVRSDMENAIAAGQAPLVVTTAAEYEARMDWLFPKQPYIPGAVAKSWAEDEISRADDNRRIWGEIMASDVTMLGELAPGIAVPSLIVWCHEDRIFHISGANVLGDALPNAMVVELEGCGHLPMLDAPTETGHALRTFLDNL